jgi:hypothetical protein
MSQPSVIGVGADGIAPATALTETGVLGGIERALGPVHDWLVSVLSEPALLGVWVVLVVLSLGVLWWDLRERNEVIPSLMQFVWTLTVLYSGPIGLGIYWRAGRTQIDHDSLWRRGFRSTSHCYSGCGAGEVIGITISQGLLALGTAWVAGVTFGFAYLFGFALTIGPLMQDGVPFGEAFRDALLSETPSITVMEIAAIGTDLLLAAEAGFGDVLFWLSLAFSLSIGFLVAYPLNVGLIMAGVKGGMSNPAEMESGSESTSAN